MRIIKYMLYGAFGFFNGVALDLFLTDWQWWVLLLIVLGVDITSYVTAKTN